MSLPKLNTAKYTLNLPSSGEELEYRPFLMSEQKNLMIAQESEDDQQIQQALANCINDCTFGKVDAWTLPAFDVEYIFLQIRSKAVGESVEIVGLGETRETTVTGIEMFQKTLEEGLAGDNVGLLLRGIQKEDIERGMVLAAPATITPHTVFEAEVYILTKEERGRHTPFFTGYRPQFYVRTTDVTGNIKQFTADDGTEVEMVMPGDRIKMTAELISAIAIEDGMRFAIREGGRTVGAGVVTKIIK